MSAVTLKSVNSACQAAGSLAGLFSEPQWSASKRKAGLLAARHLPRPTHKDEAWRLSFPEHFALPDDYLHPEADFRGTGSIPACFSTLGLSGEIPGCPADLTCLSMSEALASVPSLEKFFFLDLGTNGEMAFYDGKDLKVTSTAAGPVFEAGGINCGVASIPGAIDHVKIEGADHRVTISTIGGAEPIGICGTGVMEAVSELVRTGLVDETGLLADEYFDKGFPLTKDGRIMLTQQDIRNVQLAKAAIYTGAKALLEGEVPDKVYISGGFGSKISQENVEELQMFPKDFNGKIIAVGNSALKGAAEYTACVLSGWESEADAAAGLDLITEKAQLTELATMDSFDEDYINAMNF